MIFLSISYWIQCLMIALPLFVAGVTFLLIIKTKFATALNVPLDFGWLIQGKRLFGAHKTFRGLILLPLLSLATSAAIMLILIAAHIDRTSILFPYTPEALPFSLTLGLAYILGELPNSFIKRRMGIAPGAEAAHPFTRTVFRIIDHVDSLVVVLLVLKCVYGIPPVYLIGVFLLGIMLHAVTNGLKRV